jgi:hypothetical protein
MLTACNFWYFLSALPPSENLKLPEVLEVLGRAEYQTHPHHQQFMK